MRLKMRNLANCYSEHAIKVSDSYCSGNSNKVYLSPSLIPSTQDEVKSLYKVKLSNHRLLFITLTWSTHHTTIDSCFTVTIVEDGRDPKHFRFTKAKGSRRLESLESKVRLVWDLSGAGYEIGPEPVNGYYVAVLVNSEMILFGEIEKDFDLKRLVLEYPFAKSSLISRHEKFSGNAQFSSKAKFFDTGTWHDITVVCVGDDRRSKNSSSSLYVRIDEKNVIQVKRLRWNFRGNQTIFLDGMLVDLMWDVHDWFFDSESSNSKSRVGIFLFRPRSGLDSRLWLEEKKLAENEEQSVGSSLLICACKNPD